MGMWALDGIFGRASGAGTANSMNLDRLHPRRTWSVFVVLALVATTVYFALRSDGNIVPELDLHDAGVWVTNESSKQVGRTNTEIAVVDSKLDAQASPFDVLQSGAVVMLRQEGPSRLAGVDPVKSLVIPGPDVPSDAQVGLGGSTAALFNPGTGGLHIAPAPNSSAALALDPAAEDGAVHVIEGPGALAVGVDGLVHLLAIETGEITTWSTNGTRVATRSVESDIDGAVITAVGATPVVLGAGSVHVPGHGATDIADLGEQLAIQLPGPDAPGVLVAADGGFGRVPLGGGDIVEIAGGGEGAPAEPVFVDGCAFGAWGGDLTYVQRCGDRDPITGRIPELESGDRLKFRVNRDRVTLNNLANGKQLLFGDDEPKFIDNQWAEALTDDIDDNPEEDDEADVQTDPECEGTNTAPTAEPDEGLFGTREGRPVLVYPLLNDSDPDCDVLLIESVELSDPGAGTLGIVGSGRAVQVEFSNDVESLRFAYTISDGRGGEESSFVTVRVVPDGQNAAPKLAREETTVVTGGSVTHNVLASAYDPDGDVLRLNSATLEDTASGSVRSNVKGDITFTASNTVGVTEITYVVGDGETEATGVLRVKVVDRNTNQAPNARADSLTTFVGREITFDVLDNDTDPDGDKLSIVRATSGADATIGWDPTSPEIRVVADKPGTVNVTYRITDGQATDEAVFRVDVHEKVDNLPPVAVRDEVLLTAGVPAFVPVVENDVDPDGSVLVVLGVDGLPEPSPITVTILQRSILKVTTPTPLAEPLTFDYRISDGSAEAVGRVLVEPAPVNDKNRPPVAVPDEYTVRAGGIAVLPVLANDSDPDGDPLTVGAPPDDQPDAATDGRLFLSPDGQLRYEAPTAPRSTIRLIYDAMDSVGNVSSAELILHVLAADDAANSPPEAPELVGRTVAGQSVTIPVPITTMDPDGDAVTFLGLGDAPSLGTVTAVGPDEFVYLADEVSAGTDEFTYRVVDAFGQEATGTVLIGVAGRSTVNNRPVPVDDQYAVRAGETAVLPVLANDTDPDGDRLTISTADDDVPLVSEGTVQVDERSVTYTAPQDPTAEEASFRYVVSDGRGLSRGATVTITFRTDDNNRPPVAVDDAASPQAVDAPVILDLVANDEDPDLDELTITEVSHPDVTIDPDGKSVSFAMGPRSFQFTYLVSDGELTARAAVFVPVVDPDADLAPIARLDDDIEVDMGDSVTIPVLANDEDPEGADLHLLQVLQPVRHGTFDFQGNDVVFTASEENYAGDAGFYYLVGDTADPGTANTSVGAVRIRIDGSVNTAPEFTQLDVEVPAAAERQVDLTAAVFDPDEGDEHAFEDLEVNIDGVSVSIDEGILTVRADADTPPGTSGVATFTVADEFDEVEGSVLVTVTSSDRPLAVLGPDDDETVQSVPITVNVLANDTNPFPETPLEIIDVGSPTGGGSASPAGSGAITYDPGPDFFGTSTITYRVADETGDPNRVVEGTLTVNVVGFPDAPAAPTCDGGKSRVSRVYWASPSANGSPITGYVLRVQGNGGGTGDRTVSTSSTQDVGGLENGKDYTFQVGAVNRAVAEAGVEPRFSPPSPTCTPDQVPDQPAAPVVSFGDGELTIRWTAPNNEGSPLEGYRLSHNQGGGSREFGPAETSATWDGLQNGTCYQFTLVAKNASGDSIPSPPSAGDKQTCVPAGKPANPAPPTLDQEPVGARSGSILVSWVRPDDNGDEISAYELRRVGGGAEQIYPAGTATQLMVSTQDGVDYTFSVRAQNKADWSDFGDGTTGRSTSKPDAPPAPTITVSGQSAGNVAVTFSAPAFDGGASINQYEIRLSNGQTKTVSGPGTHVVNSVPHCQAVSATVRASNATDGWGDYSGASTSVQTYADPTVTSLTGQTNTTGNPSATWATNRGGSCAPGPTVRFQDRNGTYTVAESGTRQVSLAEGQSSTVTVTISNSGPRGSLTHSRQTTVSRKAPPPPGISLTKGASAPHGYWYSVSLSNFSPGQSVALYCHDSVDSGGFYAETVTVSSSGSYSDKTLCYSADGPGHWVTGGGRESNHVSW